MMRIKGLVGSGLNPVSFMLLHAFAGYSKCKNVPSLRYTQQKVHKELRQNCIADHVMTYYQ